MGLMPSRGHYNASMDYHFNRFRRLTIYQRAYISDINRAYLADSLFAHLFDIAKITRNQAL